jgi:Uma2 family endonuclease
MFPELVRQAQAIADQESAAREEFLKNLTADMKAEFILGEVEMHSPARAKHLDITLNLAFALKSYLNQSGNGRAFVEKCLVSLTRNDFEPDIVWFSSEKAAPFTPDQMRFPAPDFVVEVLSESTVSRDRGIKFEDYALHGVTEYWIIDPDAETVEQYLLPDGEDTFKLAEKLGHGTALSRAISGFEIALTDLFA